MIEITFDQNVDKQKQWLYKQLYDMKEATGDMIFVFPSQEDLEVPLSQFSQSSNIEMKDEERKSIKCHQSIIKNRTPYFQGQSNFMQQQKKKEQDFSEIKILNYPFELIDEIVKYFYLGQCKVNSNDIYTMLEICQEYLIDDLKQLIEMKLIKNIDNDNFRDNMQLARTFECNILREALYLYG